MEKPIFIEVAAELEIRGGMAYFTDVSGYRCMSVNTLRRLHEVEKRALAQWDADQRGNIAVLPRRECG